VVFFPFYSLAVLGADTGANYGRLCKETDHEGDCKGYTTFC